MAGLEVQVVLNCWSKSDNVSGRDSESDFWSHEMVHALALWFTGDDGCLMSLDACKCGQMRDGLLEKVVIQRLNCP